MRVLRRAGVPVSGKDILWRFRCWRKGYPVEVYKTISPHPAPERTLERLRKRVQTGDWVSR